MTNVVIVGIGTRGDVAPLTGVAVRLRDAGHHVVVAAHALFADLITGCGLEFRQLGEDVTDADLAGSDLAGANPVKLVMAAVAPKTILGWGEEMLTALRDEPADVLLLSPFAEFAGWQLAEKLDVPAMGLRMQPLSTTAAHPASVLGSWSAGPVGNRAVGHLATATVDRLYADAVARIRDGLGLPAVPARALRRRRTEAGARILHGFSPHVVPRPGDWRAGLDVVGYWWPQRPNGWRPPDELVAFLGDGPPPVYLGFGSMLAGRAESERLSRVALGALRRAGVRGVIQEGWARLDVAADDVITIGDVPHDWLFDRVAAVVHACGAGTAGAGLLAGVPAVAVPTAGDQFFWARRLRDLGVSAATLSRRKLTVEGLATAIHRALTDSGHRDRAKQLAATIADDDGAGAVLSAVDAVS